MPPIKMHRTALGRLLDGSLREPIAINPPLRQLTSIECYWNEAPGPGILPSLLDRAGPSSSPASVMTSKSKVRLRPDEIRHFVSIEMACQLPGSPKLTRFNNRAILQIERA